MSTVTWNQTPPTWTAVQGEETVCVLKGKDIGGWTAGWQQGRMWAPPTHLPKAQTQPTRFFMNLDEAKAAVEAALQG